MWATIGYNFAGFKEDEFSEDVTRKGLFFRLRYKFDENDRCPNTEAGKKVDQRGCPEILLSMNGINFNTDSS